MDRKLPVILMVILIFILSACRCKSGRTEQSKGKTVYDSLKAKKYGADKYGMKKYVMAFLKKGPNRNLDSAQSAKLQMAHLKNIIRMANEGKLVLAGPFLDDGNLRGIYIFNFSTIEEAKKLAESDPAIKAGSLTMELKEWYGSAALMEVNKIHKSLSKVEIVK